MSTYALVHGGGDTGWSWQARSRGESSAAHDDPWPLPAWPDVPTRVIVCTEDRFFPAPFLRRVAAQRLGVTVEEIEAGHHVAAEPTRGARLPAGRRVTTSATRALLRKVPPSSDEFRRPVRSTPSNAPPPPPWSPP